MTSEELANEIERLSYGWTIHYGWPESIKVEVVRILRQAEHEARLVGALAMRQEATDIVDDWKLHYPEDIFIPPPPGEHGKTVDACSAAAIRTITPRIAVVISEIDATDIVERLEKGEK